MMNSIKNDSIQQDVLINNLAQTENASFFKESPTLSVTEPLLFKIFKGIGKLGIVIWVPSLFLLLIMMLLIASGGGKAARFYRTYGVFLIFFELALFTLAIKTTHNPKKYITAISPFLLLIIGFAVSVFFDTLPH